MVRTCNGLELRDQIPPLPPPVALSKYDPNLLLDHHNIGSSESINLCKLHGSPKTTSRSTSPHHHRVQNINLMDDMPLPFPSSSTTIQQQQQQSMSSNLIDTHHSHHQHQQTTTNSIIDHPLTPAKKLTTSSSQTNGGSTSHTHYHHYLHRQQSGASSSCHSPAPLHPHQHHQSTTTSDLLGSCSNNVINSMTASTTGASSICGTGICSESSTSKHQPTQQQVAPKCSSGVRHRWHACPELHKAMDGVTYIADHTRKEEESNRVRKRIF